MFLEYISTFVPFHSTFVPFHSTFVPLFTLLLFLFTLLLFLLKRQNPHKIEVLQPQHFTKRIYKDTLQRARARVERVFYTKKREFFNSKKRGLLYAK